MDGFLHSQEEGRLDSSGHFRLDPEGMRRVLSSYLDDPLQAVLQVVRAAVLTQAEGLQIQSDPHETVAEFPGVLAPSPEMVELPRWLLGGPSLGARFHLSLAVQGGAEGSDVQVTSWDGQQCARLRLDRARPPTFELSHEPPWRSPRTRVRWVRSQGRGAVHVLKKGLFGARDEDRLVMARCGYAPLELMVNRRPVPRPPFGHPRQPELRIYCRAPQPGWELRLFPAPQALSRTVDRLPLPGPGDSQPGGEGVLVAALSRREGGLRLVLAGVELPKALPWSGSAVVSAGGLDTDLSGQKLLESAWQKMKKELEAYLQLLGS